MKSPQEIGEALIEARKADKEAPFHQLADKVMETVVETRAEVNPARNGSCRINRTPKTIDDLVK